MPKITIVIEDARVPVSLGMQVLGGTVTAAMVGDHSDCAEALNELVQINQDHNNAISAITGKPIGWNDSYLDQARTALAKADWSQP